jgi:hypothetical protein
MSMLGQTQDDGIFKSGLFTHLRPFAGWFLIAVMIAGFAQWALNWAVWFSVLSHE